MEEVSKDGYALSWVLAGHQSAPVGLEWLS